MIEHTTFPQARSAPRSEPWVWILLALLTDDDGCLLWPGRVSAGAGYPRIGAAALHRFVAEFARGPAPPGTEASHTCGIKRCCSWHHIKWETPAANAARKVAHGTVVRGEAHGRHKLSEADVHAIRARYRAGGISLAALAAEYGVGTSTIHHVVAGRNWAWLV